MTENLFRKKEWNEKDWSIYLNNLDLLRNSRNLSKTQLSSMVGVYNLYRTDMKKPGEATILKLCAMFNITEGWLSEAHAQTDMSERLDPMNDFITSEPIASYITRRRLRGSQLIAMAAEIIESGDQYSDALAVNIEAFYRAIQTERRVAHLEDQVRELKREVELLKKGSTSPSIEEPTGTRGT